MHYNGPPQGVVIYSFFQAFQFKRITMLAPISIPGKIKAQAAFIRSRLIGKSIGHLPPGIPAMRYPGLKKQGIIVQVYHVQTLFIRRLTKIYNGKYLLFLSATLLNQSIQAF